MVKIDLITGFLGSGKTTFIREYVKYLLGTGERICILENDYGAINVDMMLLSDLQNDRLGLEMVAGGCDYDCHRRRFKTKLITMAMLGYDRVIVEPSGIFDVDEFYDILHEDRLCDMYEINNVLAVVNAESEELSSESMAMFGSQIATAGCVVLSRVQNTDNNEIDKTVGLLNEAMNVISCKRRFVLGENIIAKDWADFDENDFRLIAASSYCDVGYVKRFSMDENGFDSLFFMNPDVSVDEVEEVVRKLFSDERVGRVLRFKGFLKGLDGSWVEVNATAKSVDMRALRQGQSLIIVIGECLNDALISEYIPAEYSTYGVKQESMNAVLKRG